MNLGWLILVLGLGALSKKYEAGYLLRPAVAYLIGFRKLWSMSQDQPFIGKVTVNSLGGTISWVGQSLRGSPGQGKQCWPGWWSLRYRTHLLALWLCWGEGSAEVQWPLPAFLSGRNLSPSTCLIISCQTLQFLFVCQWWLSSCYPCAGSSEEVSLSELVCGFFKRTCWDSRSFFQWFNPCWLLQPEVMEIYLPGTGLGDLLWGWGSSLPRYPILHLHPSSQSGWMWFL